MPATPAEEPQKGTPIFAKLLEAGYPAELKKAAEQFIAQERLQHKLVFDTILEYCTASKLLISNLDFLLDRHPYWETIELYALNVADTAAVIAKELCHRHGEKFLLKITTLDEEYIIEYNLRRICYLHRIRPYKQFTLYDFISPVIKNGLYLMPHILEVMSLYAKLYNPANADDWEDLHTDIRALEGPIDKYLRDLLRADRKALAAKLTTSTEAKKMVSTCTMRRNKVLDGIQKVVNEFVAEGNYVHVPGGHAPGGHTPDVPVVITPNAVSKDYQRLTDYLAKYTSYGVVMKKKNLYLPKEPFMEKYAIYLQYPCGDATERRHILTLYNNATYELIAYQPQPRRVVDVVVAMRFLYIDVWISIISQKAHGLRFDEFHAQLEALHGAIKQGRTQINLEERREHYIGDFLNTDIQKKMHLLTHPNRFKSNFYCRDLQSDSTSSS